SEVGISSDVIELPVSTKEEQLIQLIDRLNDDSSVHGILVQLPLPNHIDEQAIIEAIAPEKDVDGFHPINIGRMMTGQDTFLPCQQVGIITLLRSTGIPIADKRAVVIDIRNIVGKPVGQLLLNENATVTYCPARTKVLRQLTTQADLLVVAIGKPHI